MNIRVLVVEDDDNTRESLAIALKQDGYEPVLAPDGETGFTILKEEVVDVVVSDVRMGKVSGFDLLEYISSHCPETAVIMITGYGTIPSAVKAMKKGAYDYLTKPIDIEKLNLVIQKAVKSQRLVVENRRLKQQLKERFSLNSIVGRFPKIQKILADLERIGPSEAPVIILGETGTGKELIARAIHYNSLRCDKPFIKLDCSALAEGIIESELFGHEKGSFTGAWKQRRGRFEIADGGTLFLDEAGNLSPAIQVKLLRVLEDQELERVGGTQTIKVNVRLISASSKDLKKEMEAGRFREDLYYRLKVVTIEIPPLRERVEDIHLLAHHFLEQACLKYGKAVRDISAKAMSLMMKYSWPGNVRELKHCIESLVIMSEGASIQEADLPANLMGLGQEERLTFKLGSPLSEIEKVIILKTLAQVKGNKVRAAETLGIGLKTLYRRLEEYQSLS